MVCSLAWILVSSAAASTACVGPDFDADDLIAAKFPALVDELHRHFAEQPAVDRCARVRLVAAGTDIVLVVTLDDGRSTVRRVAHAEDVEGALDALLMLPSKAPEPPTEAWHPTPPPPPIEPSKTEVRPPKDRGGFEIGVAAVARMTGRPLFVGPSAAAFAEIVRGRWLVSVGGHFEPVMVTTTPAPPHYRYESFGLGVGAGRKFGGEGLDVDVVVGLGLLMQRQEAVVAGIEARAKDVDPRAFAAVRASDPSTPLRAYVGAEIEAWAPPRAGDAPPPELVSWPYWSVSFAFGVKWEAK